MNFIQNVDENQLKEVLLHYKKFYLSLGIIVISALIIFIVILPQFQLYMDQQSQIQDLEERISNLKKNIQYISSINDETQGNDIQITTTALPGEKDYAGILYAIRTASSKTGVLVGDFTFSVGDISGKSTISKSIPVISMDLSINGDLQDVRLFLSELSKIFPLSNITQITLSKSSSKLIVNFYYKPIPGLKVNYTTPIMPIAGANQKLLETLRGWQTDRPAFDLAIPTEGSGSAVPF